MEKKVMAIAIAAVVVIAGIAAAIVLMNNQNDSETIIIASSPYFVPYDYQLGMDWAGIDMDICIAVCKEINCKYEFMNVQFDSIIPGVHAGKYTMGASGFTITEERKESVLFSDTYATIKNVVVVPVGSSITTYDDAKAAKSGAQSGTTGHLNAEKEGFNITAYNTYSDVFQNLKQGKIDCIVLDSDMAKSFILSSENVGQYKILDDVKIGEDEYYAFVFKLDNTALCEKFNTGLKKLKDDGTLEKIVKYYAENNFSNDTPSYWTTH